ncbi:hypothetical protein GCM10023091_09620 [Ravibacter arvi]|uniref:Polysaccharide chain length determinant N-terminal domain-containing protein n=1 Tax=Ravibacter arvi TaxID=2051041 RepID=A0ABP8LSI4_9BACT
MEKVEIIDIDISKIIRFVKRHIRACLILGFLFAVLGYLFSYTRDKVYASKMTLLPEANNAQMGGIGALFGLAKLNEAGEAVRPDLYPSVLKSYPFAQYMLQQPVIAIPGVKYEKLSDFYRALRERDESEGFFTKIFPSKGEKPAETDSYKNLDSTIYFPTKKERSEIKWILGSITCEFELRSGIVTITSEALDPLVAAKLADLSAKYLIDFVTDYRAQKQGNHVNFLTVQVANAKSKARQAEVTLQRHRDTHRNIFLNTDKIEEQRLATEYQLQNSTYLDLERQLTEANMLLKRDKPVFKILEPARADMKTVAPRRLWIAVGFAILSNVIFIFYLVMFRYGWWKRISRM